MRITTTRALSALTCVAALRRRVAEAAPFPPEIVPAHFVHDAALHGAIALALAAAQPRGGAAP
jgi:glucokinase